MMCNVWYDSDIMVCDRRRRSGLSNAPPNRKQDTTSIQKITFKLLNF